MHETPASLLFRLRKSPTPDQWERFVEIYAPIVRIWARRAGLQDADLADITQEVFAVLLRELPRFEYDPSRRFRGWLRQVVTNVWRTHSRRRRQGSLEDGAEPQVEDPTEDFWETEYRAHLTRRAMMVMERDFEPTTWRACWAVVVERRPASEVAQEFGMSPGAVYAAKFRVIARLRQELQGMLD